MKLPVQKLSASSTRLLAFMSTLTLTAAQSPVPVVDPTPPSTEQNDSDSAAPPPNKTPAFRAAVALRATRPWSFTATVGPVALGTALAFKIEDAFSAPLFGLTLVTTLAVHAAGNLINTLVDFLKGLDTPGSSDLTLVKGELTSGQAPHELLLPMWALGAGSAYVYTGGPGLKYRALGDVLISLTFGPLLVAFAYATQAGSLGWRPLLAALPITLHIEAILHANNARDVAEDLAAGVRTIAARLGEAHAFRFYQLLLLAPYVAPLYGAACHSLFALLPLLTLPKARALVADFQAGRMVGLPKRTAKFQFLFGVMFIFGVLLPAPNLLGLGTRLVRAVQSMM